MWDSNQKNEFAQRIGQDAAVWGGDVAAQGEALRRATFGCSLVQPVELFQLRREIFPMPHGSGSVHIRFGSCTFICIVRDIDGQHF